MQTWNTSELDGFEFSSSFPKQHDLQGDWAGQSLCPHQIMQPERKCSPEFLDAASGAGDNCNGDEDDLSYKCDPLERTVPHECDDNNCNKPVWTKPFKWTTLQWESVGRLVQTALECDGVGDAIPTTPGPNHRPECAFCTKVTSTYCSVCDLPVCSDHRRAVRDRSVCLYCLGANPPNRRAGARDPIPRRQKLRISEAGGLVRMQTLKPFEAAPPPGKA